MVCDSSNDKPRDVREIPSGLEESIRQLGHDTLLVTFRNGIPPEKVKELLSDSNLAPHADLIDLYLWHDGSSDVNVRRLGDMYFFPGFYFLSLSEALSSYRTFLTDPRWRPAWLLTIFSVLRGPLECPNREIAKDLELLARADRPVSSVEWWFSTSRVTGRGGPSEKLRSFLERSGITPEMFE
jgi:hypothetical protein